MPNTAPIAPTPALLKRYDRPGPRYTSYPTANEFTTDFGIQDYYNRLDDADSQSSEPLSVYLHLPFCEARCSFCACNVIITKKREVAAKYLDYLEREIAMIAQRLSHRREVVQYHWGGGTPTYLTPDEIRKIRSVVTRHFDIAPDAEVAIEVDPRVTSTEHIDTLKELGWNRLSMGVQDFTPGVQALINRNQTEEQTRRLYDYCRKVGFKSINLDLIYGLPGQSPDTFAENLKAVLEMRPERLAVYSYAHVPWIKAHQDKYIDTDLLPSPDTKLELLCQTMDLFTSSGYRQIGMDHFAVPDDELSTALDGGTLHRNFMGYTTKAAPDFVGFGISSIGDVAGGYAQNTKKLSEYYESLDAGSPPLERGYRLADDDKIRRHVIQRLMCRFQVDAKETSDLFRIDFSDYFAVELGELTAGGGFVDDGMVEVTPKGIDVKPLGQMFVRNVAMTFDAYLRSKQKSDKPVFSRTV
ncbi:MAG: oxygen-independent coproporphyrinogen III oxidase [Candidatus Latescibacteria bacterium]|nr:oxygen-independent coproporphyrinogen III oxidase [Candidatus Latescibacterota bacterium]